MIQKIYQWIYIDCFNRSTLYFDTIGSLCLTIICYWTIGLAYTFVDLTERPQLIFRYRTQDKVVSWSDVIRTCKVVLFNQLVVTPIASVIFHYILEWRGIDSSLTIPSGWIILLHLILFTAIQEIAFYYLHRLLHHRWLYRTIHKMHHRWQAPIAIAAIYCHPSEHILGNLIPVLTGPFVLGSHRLTLLIWLIIIHFFTLNDHSGYHLPLFPSPEFHDYHHLK